jgi:hypothetical protein
VRVGAVWQVAGSSSGGGADPRHRRGRAHCTAGCTLNEAFVEIVQTAKAHNVSTLGLADALVALAQDQASQDGQDAAVGAARAAWAHLLDRARPRRNVRLVATTTAFPVLRTP